MDVRVRGVGELPTLVAVSSRVLEHQRCTTVSAIREHEGGRLRIDGLARRRCWDCVVAGQKARCDTGERTRKICCEACRRGKIVVTIRSSGLHVSAGGRPRDRRAASGRLNGTMSSLATRGDNHCKSVPRAAVSRSGQRGNPIRRSSPSPQPVARNSDTAVRIFMRFFGGS